MPRRPFVAKLLRFPPELETRLTALAGRERRTFTAQVVLMLEQWFEEHEQRREQERQDDRPPG
jgi:predicted DNA-binding protein